MQIPFAFFGSPPLSIAVLEALIAHGFKPSVIITAPDKPQGRHMTMTPPVTKTWAEKRNIPVLQPSKLDSDFTYKLKATSYKLFIVASYGKIVPASILDIPAHGTLNVHPSLLPKYRGPSPIRSQILADDRDTGVSIILLDEKVDCGPIVASKTVPVGPWPPRASVLENILAKAGGELLAEVLPDFLSGKLKPIPQEHGKATFTKKIVKEDGLLDLDPRRPLPTDRQAYQNFLKIQALESWPGTYFFVDKNGKKLRVIVKDARYENGKLEITRVVPEGGSEMSYEDFIRGLR